MSDKKYRRDRLNKGLREIAAEMGYTPGEFSLLRFTEDAKQVKGWMDDLKYGRTPEDFVGMQGANVQEIVRKEAAALIERERAWLPFFYPTMKSTDVNVSGPGGEPLRIEIVRHGDTAPE